MRGILKYRKIKNLVFGVDENTFRGSSRYRWSQEAKPRSTAVQTVAVRREGKEKESLAPPFAELWHGGGDFRPGSG